MRPSNPARRESLDSPVFCTIATRDFIPWALVLFDSLRRHHPSARRVLLYVQGEGEAPAFPVLDGVEVAATATLLDSDAEAQLRRRYTVAEFCFALKPRLLRHLLDHVAKRAIYLDSDIDVRAPLAAALAALEEASAVLTPHLDAPIPMDGKLPSEMTILRAGSCNLGFVAVRECDEARRLLEWWGSRVSRWGFVLPELGYQGDQKWMDLAPSLFPGVRLLRDAGSNVGPWNLHSRTVARTATGYEVNGAPLAFFHFSGFDPDRPERLSKYQNRFDLARLPVVAELARDYARRLLQARSHAQDLEWRELPLREARAAGAATAVDGALPDDAYVCALSVDALGGTQEVGEEAMVRTRITNASAHPWAVAKSAEEKGGIALSWHLRDAQGAVLVWDNPRHPLPHDLAPGESVTVTMPVRMPAAPGRYAIEVDLIHEGIAWFGARGNATATVDAPVGLFVDPDADSKPEGASAERP